MESTNRSAFHMEFIVKGRVLSYWNPQILMTEGVNWYNQIYVATLNPYKN